MQTCKDRGSIAHWPRSPLGRAARADRQSSPAHFLYPMLLALPALVCLQIDFASISQSIDSCNQWIHLKTGSNLHIITQECRQLPQPPDCRSAALPLTPLDHRFRTSILLSHFKWSSAAYSIDTVPRESSILLYHRFSSPKQTPVHSRLGKIISERSVLCRAHTQWGLLFPVVRYLDALSSSFFWSPSSRQLYTQFWFSESAARFTVGLHHQTLSPD